MSLFHPPGSVLLPEVWNVKIVYSSEISKDQDEIERGQAFREIFLLNLSCLLISCLACLKPVGFFFFFSFRKKGGQTLKKFVDVRK